MDAASYLDRVHPLPDALLLELERLAGDGGISRETGRLLSTLVTAMQASRILEIGTGIGYATLWMAKAQPRTGKIWTIEPDASRRDVALSYFARAGEDDAIEVLHTQALELLGTFPHRNLDLVFVATGKSSYGRYLDIVLPMLKLSGLAIFADCLLGGRVAAELPDGDEPDVRAMREFIPRFLSHPALDATLLPIGGGTAIGARRR